MHRQTGRLRVTDHKTGKDRTEDTLVIGGGSVLQPLLYAAVAETMLGVPVGETRLFFCTVGGGFSSVPCRSTRAAARAAIEALEIIDRAVERGILAPAPAEGACAWCDFRPVCGPGGRAARRAQAAGVPARPAVS